MRIKVSKKAKDGFFAAVGEDERRANPTARSSGGKKNAPARSRTPRPTF